MNIQEINKMDNGTRVISFFLIKAIEKRTTKTDKPYMDLLLMDDGGEIETKWWDIKSHDDADFLSTGKLIKAEGTIDRYQDKVQFTIKKVRLATEKDGVKVEDYIRSAPVDADTMMKDIKAYIGRIKDNYIKKIVIDIVAEKVEELKYFPAAKKNHHAFRGGLLYHTTSMLKLADAVCALYPHLNSDLLFGGIIIHDLEKISEMDSDEAGIVSDYTKKGKLLGHIPMGAMNVKRIAEKIGAPEEQTDLLIHVVLAHHGKLEFGSPITPMIPEAEAIHHIDNLDAKMNTYKTALEGVGYGEFSDRIFSLGNKQVYKAAL